MLSSCTCVVRLARIDLLPVGRNNRKPILPRKFPRLDFFQDKLHFCRSIQSSFARTSSISSPVSMPAQDTAGTFGLAGLRSTGGNGSFLVARTSIADRVGSVASKDVCTGGGV